MEMGFPVVSLTEFMFSKFHRFLNNIAMVELDTERSVTYRELKSMIVKAARGFQNLGVKEGDVVCIYTPNNIEYAVTLYSLCSFGAILQATNPLYTAGELRAQLVQCKTKYIITIPSLLDKVKDSRTDTVEGIIIVGEADGCIRFNSLLVSDSGHDVSKAMFDPKKKPAVYLFSSGTTGLPKAVEVSHYNIVANLIQLKPLDIIETDSILVFLPFYHIYALTAILTFSLTSGSKMVIMSKFVPTTFMSAIEKYMIDVTHLVPSVMVLLAKLPETNNYDLTSIRKACCGAASLSQDIEDKVNDIFKISFISQGYGMTEVIVTHLNTDDSHKIGSVGKALEGVQVKICDTRTGETLKPNQDGEVCIKSPSVMLGYLNNQQATEEMILKDGWTKTGDVGHIDEDGFLFIVDRIKELIKYKGHQVAPAELEALLLKHPSIADVGVIGVLDNEAGEIPKAFVVLKKDVKMTEAEIQNYVKEHVAPHKRLRGGVEFLEQIPKSASGKILRRILRDRT